MDFSFDILSNILSDIFSQSLSIPLNITLHNTALVLRNAADYGTHWFFVNQNY